MVACVFIAPVLQVAQDGLPTLLSLVCGYVANYEEQLGFIIGQEDYTQLAFSPVRSATQPGTHVGERVALRARRRLRSEFALLKLPVDEQRWIGVRDVFEVDGRKVADRTGRLSALLKLPFGTADDQWRALEEESSRFNIGGVRRTINVPTFVLLFLRCDNQHRFVFEAPRLDGEDVVVDYREVTRPTFIRDDRGDDEPARGSFRAKAASGAVVTTHLVVGLAETDVHAEVDVTFKVDPKLRLLVPDEMRERYSAPLGQRVEGVARYREFKRFEVGASWKVRP